MRIEETFTVSELVFMHMAMKKQMREIQTGKAIGLGNEDIKEAQVILDKLSKLIEEKTNAKE